MRQPRAILDVYLAASVLLLLLHWYYYCYGLFAGWGLATVVTDGLLRDITATGLFKNVNLSKLLALLLLVLSFLGRPGQLSETIRIRNCLLAMAIGLTLYFGGSVFLPQLGGGYILVTLAGYGVTLVGIGWLARRIGMSYLKDDPFGEEQGGFPQEERKVETDFSLHLPGQYVHKEKERSCWINIINPRRGVLIAGSPGSGKSRYIIEPFIRQLMSKGVAMFIYDFKYDSLTRLVRQLFQVYGHCYPEHTRLCCINFTDVSASDRCNVLEAATLDWVSDAIGASRTLLLGLNKTWIHRQGEFFVESPINFLGALIWFLKRYEGGRHCTLPHAIELAQIPYGKLFSILSLESEIRSLINPFVEAYQHNNMELLDSQVSSARIPLGRLVSPDIYYVLTGNDFTLDINDPAAPKIFCLGGDPSRIEGLAPVISLYIDRMNRQINKPGKYPCALVCDEFATVRAYSMSTTIATARSNNIVSILAIQDISQLRTQYSREEADTMMNICGNILCGQVGGETARWVSERFPRIQREKKSISANSGDTSVSHSLQWDYSVTPATIAQLSSGEFVGVVADDPDKRMELKAFHARLGREPFKDTALRGHSIESSPISKVCVDDGGGAAGDRDAIPGDPAGGSSPAVVLEVFRQVRKDVEELVEREYERMHEDPGLRCLIVRKGD